MLIAGNWKMFKGPSDARAFFDEFEPPDDVDPARRRERVEELDGLARPLEHLPVACDEHGRGS